SSNQGIEASRGWANVLSTARKYSEITRDLGRTFEIAQNTYKPFPCGIVIHPAIAAAIARGTVGEKEFGDAAAKDPELVALRGRVTAEVTPAVAEDQVHVFITLKDGRLLEKQIEHAIGSAKNPMTDAQLEAKFA